MLLAFFNFTFDLYSVLLINFV